MKDRFQYRAKDVKTGEWRYGFYAELPYGLGSSGCNGEYADVDSFILNCKTKQSALYSNAEPHEIVVAEQNRIDIKTLSQCTGLKDKNGKLIYEGDVIKFIDVTPGSTKETSICGVFFKTRGAYYSTIPLERLPKNITEHDINYSNGRFGVDMCIGYSFLSGEIIGNVYENPELLEE